MKVRRPQFLRQFRGNGLQLLLIALMWALSGAAPTQAQSISISSGQTKRCRWHDASQSAGSQTQRSDGWKAVRTAISLPRSGYAANISGSATIAPTSQSGSGHTQHTQGDHHGAQRGRRYADDKK